jgi:RND family efflux transporter MFP subunit
MTTHWKFPHILLLLAALSVGLTSGCSKKESSVDNAGIIKSSGSRPAVWVTTVQRGSLEETIPGTGTLEGWEDVQMLAKVSGTVTRINARLGDQLQKDSVILEIEPKVRELQQAQAEAALLQAEANYETSQADLQRYEALYKNKDISDVEIEKTRAAAKKSLGMLNSAQAAVDLAKRMVADSRVSAPLDGYLASLEVEVGESVSPGMSICRVVRIHPLKLRLGLTESEIARVKKNQKVELVPDAFPDMRIIGRIHRIGVAADLQSRLFPVEIEVSDFPENVKPGMVARARILLHEYRDVIVIPRQAILQSRDGQIVFIVENSMAHIVPVTLGAGDDTKVIITSGVDEGDQLVIRGQHVLQDSVSVKIEVPNSNR